MSAKTVPIAKFRLGKIVVTAHAGDVLTSDDILKGICRHQAGEWGDVREEDRKANEVALTEGTRLWSVYHSAEGVRFWIITEANRSHTTVMLPEDY